LAGFSHCRFREKRERTVSHLGRFNGSFWVYVYRPEGAVWGTTFDTGRAICVSARFSLCMHKPLRGSPAADEERRGAGDVPRVCLIIGCSDDRNRGIRPTNTGYTIEVRHIACTRMFESRVDDMMQSGRACSLSCSRYRLYPSHLYTSEMLATTEVTGSTSHYR
jgi:hypothetical protein